MKPNPVAASFSLMVALLFLQGCNSGSTNAVPGNDDPIQPDGRLETVTWNLEWYGTSNLGPGDEELQTRNILQVMDSLKADLYAFQEVRDQPALDRIVKSMEGYRGFTAEFISQNQRTAFVYNTSTIDSLSAGAITENQDSYHWASGRFPLFFSFDYRYRNNLVPIYTVVIHAKAFDDRESYERRKNAAESLHRFLMNRQPDTRIILLGDYNDDVDESIFDENPSPYQVFLTDEQHFSVITSTLSERGAASTVFYPDVVDHITISDELFSSFIKKSEQIYTKAEEFIPSYGKTTSDHYPVWAKFDFSSN